MRQRLAWRAGCLQQAWHSRAGFCQARPSVPTRLGSTHRDVASGSCRRHLCQEIAVLLTDLGPHKAWHLSLCWRGRQCYDALSDSTSARVCHVSAQYILLQLHHTQHVECAPFPLQAPARTKALGRRGARSPSSLTARRANEKLTQSA